MNPIVLGSPTLPRTGDSLRQAGQKINANFDDLYTKSFVVPITSDLTFYVATTGSDANNGLTVGAPFLTVQKAVDTAWLYIIRHNVTVTIQIANGTYTLTSSIIIRKQLLGGQVVVPKRSLVINGNAGSPGSVILTSSTASIFDVRHMHITIQNLEMRCTLAGGACVAVAFGGVVDLPTGIRFGASAGSQAHVNVNACSVVRATSYTVAGGSVRHVNVQNGSFFRVFSGSALTFSGTPAFTTLFQGSGNAVTEMLTVTYSGAVTGQSYSQATNSCLVSTNTIPGTAGATSTGAVYSSTSRR